MLRFVPVVAALLAAVPASAAEDVFVVRTNPFVMGQAMDWLDDRHVVWHDPTGRDEDHDGEVQIYRSTLDGAEKACLTCGLAGPNQVPVVQPHGRWILFHSWSRHRLGRLGDDPPRGAAHEPDALRRAARQLPRLLVARRPLDRLDGAQLGSL